MSENRTSDILVSFGIGILVGAVGGVLLAPGAGAETRRRLTELGENTLDRARAGIDTARQAAAGQAGRLGQAIKVGREAYEREVVKGQGAESSS